MTNIDRTIDIREKERIAREINFAKEKLSEIYSVKISSDGRHYFFADKNGNNVLPKRFFFRNEFGYYIGEDENNAKFAIRLSDDDDATSLLIPKANNGLVIGTEQPDLKYLEVLVECSIAPRQVKEKRKAKAAKQQAQATGANKKAAVNQ